MLGAAALWGAMAVGAYGTICAVAQIISLVRSLRRPVGLVTYLVLVRNHADWLEGVVRTLLADEESELLLADLGSADESPEILEKLEADYDQARVLRLGVYERQVLLAAAVETARTPFLVVVDLSRSMEEKGKS